MVDWSIPGVMLGSPPPPNSEIERLARMRQLGLLSAQEYRLRVAEALEEQENSE